MVLLGVLLSLEERERKRERKKKTREKDGEFPRKPPPSDWAAVLGGS